jgi:hypothetical protein
MHIKNRVGVKMGVEAKVPRGSNFHVIACCLAPDSSNNNKTRPWPSHELTP